MREAGASVRDRSARTLVVFHAHPDDEVLLTAGTMALAVDQGHRVVLVVATDGGLGSTRVRLGRDESLGGIRLGEVREAARVLGVQRLVHLGYADSGADQALPDDPPGHTRFARAPLDEAAGRLAQVLSEEDADVLVTDDAGGGYGHRDHLRAHHVGTRAARLADTPRTLRATIPMIYTSARLITHGIDVRDQLPLKREALRAHVSQSSAVLGGDRSLVRCLRLPPWLFGWLFGREWFVGDTRPRRRIASEIFTRSSWNS